jgi:hypothetical protein
VSDSVFARQYKSRAAFTIDFDAIFYVSSPESRRLQSLKAVLVSRMNAIERPTQSSALLNSLRLTVLLRAAPLDPVLNDPLATRARRNHAFLLLVCLRQAMTSTKASLESQSYNVKRLTRKLASRLCCHL